MKGGVAILPENDASDYRREYARTRLFLTRLTCDESTAMRRTSIHSSQSGMEIRRS
jgi:hypothetical protein